MVKDALRVTIDPAAKSAILTVGQESFDLVVSALDPIDSIRGAQQRLRSLGLYVNGSVQDRWDEESIEALKRFQSAYVLTTDDESPSGQFDDATRRKLAEVYGC